MSKLAQFENVGSLGIIQDLAPERLPADPQSGFAWSSLKNCRMQNGEVLKMPGYHSVISCSVEPWFVAQVIVGDTPNYIYLSDKKAYVFVDNYHYDITRQSIAQQVINLGGTSFNTGGGVLIEAGAQPRCVCQLANGDLLATGFTSGKVYRSSDNGATWDSGVLIDAAALLSGITQLANGDVLCMGFLSGKVYHSTNNGVSWTTSTGPTAGLHDVVQLSNGTVLTVSYNGDRYYTSTDNGVTWAAPYGLFFAGAGLLGATQLTNGNILMTGFKSHKVYLSSDMGSTWTSAATPTGFAGITQIDTGDILATGYLDSKIYKSTDGGLTWDGGVFVDGGANLVGIAQLANLHIVTLGWSTDKIYDGLISAGITGTDTTGRVVHGYQVVDVGGAKTGATSTGLNSAPTYTADITVDGVLKSISISGSAAQTYTTLLSEINTDLGASAIASLSGGNLLVTSNTTGLASTVSIVDTGTKPLFSTLTNYVAINTAVGGTASPLEAIITIDGIPKTVSLTAAATLTYADFINELSTALGVLATVTLEGGNIVITSNVMGLGASSILITETNLFNTLPDFVSIANPINSVAIDYTVSSTSSWNHCMLNSFPVFNNGYDDPQYWQNPQTDSVALKMIPGWVEGTKCASMRSFKAYLIAMDITDPEGVRTPSKVKWSGAALPGAMPATWDITDVTNDAAEQSLADTPDAVVDGLALGDNFFLYKKRATYMMSYVGGQKIFAIQKVFPDSGMLARDCVANVEGMHFVVTPEDIIMHNGSSKKSIVDGTNRNWFFNNLNQQYGYRTFVVNNHLKSEVWICYPNASSEFVNAAFIYNYLKNTWTKRDLPKLYSMLSTTLDLSTPPTFDSFSSETYDAADRIFNYSTGGATSRRLFAGLPGTSQIVTFDSQTSNTDGGTPFTSTAERLLLPLEPEELIKTVKRIWPRTQTKMDSPLPLMVYVGSSMTKSGSVTWKGPFPFDVVNQTKVDCFVTGRYISIRFSTSTDTDWSLQSFDLEYDLKGRF